MAQACAGARLPNEHAPAAVVGRVGTQAERASGGITEAKDIGMLFQCGHVLVVPTRRGAFAVNRNDQIMTPALAMYGEYGEDELEVLERFLKPGMVVLDVGAHIGTHSI